MFQYTRENGLGGTWFPMQRCLDIEYDAWTTCRTPPKTEVHIAHKVISMDVIQSLLNKPIKWSNKNL